MGKYYFSTLSSSVYRIIFEFPNDKHVLYKSNTWRHLGRYTNGKQAHFIQLGCHKHSYIV